MTYASKAGFLAVVLTAASAAAGDQIIYSQPPGYSGGGASDTDFTTESGQHDYWQRLADDITLPFNAQATVVSWYGFYYLNDQAPSDETMRVRLYGSRASDGLPDDTTILYEQTVENPSREWTGVILPVSVGPHEYKYTVNLDAAMTFAADTQYWLEIAQIGDPATDFYWETGYRTPFDGVASANPLHPTWHAIGPPTEMSFELSTPEPATGCLLACGLALPILNRSRYSVAAQGQQGKLA